MTESHHHQHESRLSRLEGVVEGLANDVKSVANSVKDLSTYIQQGNKTNWAIFPAWGAMILTISVLAASPFVRDIKRVESELYLIESEYLRKEHAATMHKLVDKRLDYVEDMIRHNRSELKENEVRDRIYHQDKK